MYYISEVLHNNMYMVTDTNDCVSERLPKNKLLELVSKGVEIAGVHSDTVIGAVAIDEGIVHPRYEYLNVTGYDGMAYLGGRRGKGRHFSADGNLYAYSDMCEGRSGHVFICDSDNAKLKKYEAKIKTRDYSTYSCVLYDGKSESRADLRLKVFGKYGIPGANVDFLSLGHFFELETSIRNNKLYERGEDRLTALKQGTLVECDFSTYVNLRETSSASNFYITDLDFYISAVDWSFNLYPFELRRTGQLGYIINMSPFSSDLIDKYLSACCYYDNSLRLNKYNFNISAGSDQIPFDFQFKDNDVIIRYFKAQGSGISGVETSSLMDYYKNVRSRDVVTINGVSFIDIPFLSGTVRFDLSSYDIWASNILDDNVSRHNARLKMMGLASNEILANGKIIKIGQSSGAVRVPTNAGDTLCEGSVTLDKGTTSLSIGRNIKNIEKGAIKISCKVFSEMNYTGKLLLNIDTDSKSVIRGIIKIVNTSAYVFYSYPDNLIIRFSELSATLYAIAYLVALTGESWGTFFNSSPSNSITLDVNSFSLPIINRDDGLLSRGIRLLLCFEPLRDPSIFSDDLFKSCWEVYKSEFAGGFVGYKKDATISPMASAVNTGYCSESLPNDWKNCLAPSQIRQLTTRLHNFKKFYKNYSPFLSREVCDYFDSEIEKFENMRDEYYERMYSLYISEGLIEDEVAGSGFARARLETAKLKIYLNDKKG